MTSSRFNPDFYRTVVHPLMSNAIATLAVLSGVYLIAALGDLRPPSAAMVILVALAPLVEAVVGNLLYLERAAAANRLRELVIYLSIVYAVVSVLQPGPLGTRFVPGGAHVAAVVPSALAWLIGFSLHNRLRGRESLSRTLADKKHEELRRAILDRQHDMALTVKEMRSANGLIVSLFLLLAILASIGSTGILGTRIVGPGSAAFILFVAYSVSAAVVVGAINGFVDDYAANGEGLSVAGRFRRRRAIAAAVVIGVVAIVAFGLSRQRSLLPLELLGRLFAWLGSLFDRRPRAADVPPLVPERSPIDPNLVLRNMLVNMETRMPPLWFRLLIRLLRRLVGAALIGAAVLFIFGPLFSPAFRAALKRIRPKSFFTQLWARIVARLRLLIRLLRSGVWRRRHRSRQDESTEEERFEYERPDSFRPSIRKRRQMGRVLTVFLSITRWGETHGLIYSRPSTAAEYLARVRELYPEKYVDSGTVLQTFYEARFSTHLLPLSRMREYVQAAKRITRT
jgi:hypothetical protein